MMDKMYEQNLLYFKELSMYILAGKQRLAQTRNGKLHDLEEKAASGLPEDAQAAKDLDSKCARFEKSFMIWNLPERFLCRQHRRSALSRIMIR